VGALRVPAQLGQGSTDEAKVQRADDVGLGAGDVEERATPQPDPAAAGIAAGVEPEAGKQADDLATGVRGAPGRQVGDE
jgi:hypothetical protein